MTTSTYVVEDDTVYFSTAYDKKGKLFENARPIYYVREKLENGYLVAYVKEPDYPESTFLYLPKSLIKEVKS